MSMHCLLRPVSQTIKDHYSMKTLYLLDEKFFVNNMLALNMHMFICSSQSQSVTSKYVNSEGSGKPEHLQSRQNLRCSLTQPWDYSPSSIKKPDPYPCFV